MFLPEGLLCLPPGTPSRRLSVHLTPFFFSAFPLSSCVRLDLLFLRPPGDQRFPGTPKPVQLLLVSAWFNKLCRFSLDFQFSCPFWVFSCFFLSF